MSPQKHSTSSNILIALLLIGFSPIAIAAVLLYFLWGAILYVAIWLTRRNQFVVFVYSNSPTWQVYIENEILPYIRNRAVILNWSERRRWKNSLPVLAFKYFGGYRNFNPLGLVFPLFSFVKRYSFYEAFKQFKHGNVESVEQIKNELFRTLEIEKPRE